MSELPTGTVTLLFTDIEGSTQLLRRLGDGYARVLADHHRLLRQAFAAYGGREVDNQGDSFFVAFAQPLDALLAAAEAQQALAVHPWPEGGAVRVRMGLHSGRPRLSEDQQRYLGLDVHQAARIEAAAHGGQVLLSQATAGLLQERLPEGLELRSLGAHRLKDFDRPVTLYQLLVAGLPSSFPPVRATRAEVEEAEPSQPALVGREAELAALSERLAAAQAGHGSLALLAGEPGIGKTRLTEELAVTASRKGVTVLWGRCWEGEGAPPFWPWRQLLRSYGEALPPLTLRAELGLGAADIQQLVPELAERLGERPDGTAGSVQAPVDPEAARFRLFDAVSRFLRNASQARPLLLVLDDLHWADVASLLLLQFLSRELGEAKLLVVGAYRDTDLDRRHPLAEALPALRRAPTFERVLLHGLSRQEVDRLLTLRAGHELDADGRQLAEALQRETEGNPFFIGESLRHLAESGKLQQSEGRWTVAAGINELGIPEGIREVIGRRLSRLAEETNRLLTVAAVIGREFDVAIVERVAAVDADAVDAALEEAEAARVVQALGKGERYRFNHALIRETLYAELPTRRRVRLHRQVGEALEQQYARALEAHLSELAYHFLEGAVGSDIEKAVAYARRAAERAMAGYAYETAARQYELALAVLADVDDEDAALRCDLLLALGDALRASGQRLRVADEIAPAATELAARHRDRGRAARVCLLALVTLVEYGGRGIWSSTAYRQWAERADREALPETPERVKADIFLADVRIAEGRPADALELSERALQLARRIDDPEPFVAAANNYFGPCATVSQWRASLRLADECMARPLEGVSTARVVRLLCSCARTYLAWGDRSRGEALMRQLRELTALSKDAAVLLWEAVAELWLLPVYDGNPTATLRAAMESRLTFEQMGSGDFGRTLCLQGALQALLELGRAEEALTALEETAAQTGSGSDAGLDLEFSTARALCLAHLGRHREAGAALTSLMTRLAVDGSDGMAAFVLFQILETAVLLEEKTATRSLAAWLAPIEGLILAPEGGSVARLLGSAAALGGDRAAAQRYCEQALAGAERIGFRSEAALCRLQLADVLLAEGDGQHAEARRQLDAAIAELRELTMRPALERALALQGTLV